MRPESSYIVGLARFTCVGAFGLLVDCTALYAALWAGLGLYDGRLVSFVTAATFTWYLNRSFTFAVRERPSTREWFRFLLANSFGGLVNLGVYSILVAAFTVIAEVPAIAVVAGSICGLLINYRLSRELFLVKGERE